MDANYDVRSKDTSNIQISDAGIYSICGLTAVLFQEFFPEKINR